MARRSRHTREELRALIIDATLRMVRRHGSDHVTARRIAEAIGYTPGMLYSVFTSLPEILVHVNAVTLETLHDDCVLAREHADGPEASIRSMGLAYLAFAERHTHQFDLLFQRIEHEDFDMPPALSQRICSLFALVERELALLAPDSSGSDCRVGARALWSGVHGTAALALSRQLYLEVEHADRDIVEMLVTRFLDSWRRR